MRGSGRSAILLSMPRILIADDHPLFRRALAQIVRERMVDVETAEAGTLAEARAELQRRPDTDLVLLDLHMPDSQGLLGLAGLRSEHPSVAVVMISAHEDARTVRRALACGAMGFIPKSADPEQLTHALRAVLDCGDYLPPEIGSELAATAADEVESLARRLAGLTPQQHRVLVQVAEGRLNKQIADALGIQERTVKAHLTAIFERLGVRNRTQAGVALRSLALADPARSLPP